MKYSLLAGFLSVSVLAAQPEPGAGSIAGHVFSSLTSAPIRKATVILTSRQSPIRLVADTDAEGRFQFTALPPGTYRLSASRAGFLDHPGRRPIALGPNDQVTDAEVRLPPQSVLMGHVVDEDGEPVDRARVWLFKLTYSNGRKLWARLNASETNDTGEYRFPSLKPGRYILQAISQRPAADNRYGSPPVMLSVPAYYPNALTEPQALPVDLGVGADVGGIDIHLSKLPRPPSVHVRGKVTGVPRDSGIQVSVRVIPADDTPFGCCGSTLASPPDYAFDLTAPPGRYTLSGNEYSGDPKAYGTATLAVTGDTVGVVLAMSPAPEITGRIVLAEGGSRSSLRGVRVTLEDLQYHQVTQEGRSDAAGQLVFGKPFRPGHYAMNVRSVPDGCFVRDIKLGGQEISADDFEISASAQLELVLSRAAGVIGGTVSDADGKPFPDSIVTLVPLDGAVRPSKQSVDDEGNFRFAGLRPGKYKLFAWEEVDDDLWQDPQFRNKYGERAKEVTVGRGETQAAKVRVISADEMK